MVKLNFEALAPGMKARLDAPHSARVNHRIVRARGAGKVKHGSINCVLADAVKMPFHRTQS